MKHLPLVPVALLALAAAASAATPLTNHWVGVGSGTYTFADYDSIDHCPEYRIEMAVLETPAGWEVAWNAGPPGTSFPIGTCNSVAPGLFGPVALNNALEGSPQEGFWAYRSNANCDHIDTTIAPLGAATAFRVWNRCASGELVIEATLAFTNA